MAAATTTRDFALDSFHGYDEHQQKQQPNTVTTNSSQGLGESTSKEEMILPPPSCWFDDDLAAAAPSDSESSSEAEEEVEHENPNGSRRTTTNFSKNNGDPTRLSVEESPTWPRATVAFSRAIATATSTNNSNSNHSSTTVAASSCSLSRHSKTPPLSSFRLDPSLTSPSVMAAPSPSWKEISSHVLPSAAKELLSASLRRICHTARLSYSKGRWTRKYSDLGNNSGGYFKTSNMEALQQFADLPPFSSLSWVDRQMVREWRTYLPTDERRAAPHNTQGEEYKQQASDATAVIVEHEEEDVDFDRARTLVPRPMPRPAFANAEICHECRKPFGPTRLRHHCRLCGYSYCQMHSACCHSLPHLGYDPDVPERVCDPCKRGLLAQNLAERVAWRLCRWRDLQGGQLTPYFETGIDTMEEAALRIAHAALATARSIPLGAQAHVAVETVEVLRKHGLNGIYGIMLRQEFLAAADLLRKALGINKTAWPLSVHELSAAIFYALAQHRAMRGINPDREEIIHTFIQENVATEKVCKQHNNIVIDETDEYNPDIEHLTSFPNILPKIKDKAKPTAVTDLLKDTATCSSSSTELPFTPVCTPVPDHVVNSLIFYAPIALNFIYAKKEVDMQLLAAQQGWRLLYAYLNPETDRDGGMVTDMPASAIFVHEQQKTACLAVRGTATIHDVVTDVRQMPVSFPEMDSTNNANDGWTSVKQGKGLAVCGMASAAVNLFREHIDVLLHLMREGYRIRITGHSLGGGVATLLGLLVLNEMEQVIARENLSTMSLAELLRVYSYGPPSCVDANLADFTKSFVTTAVLHDDVVPRLTPTSCRGLLKHLLHIRETWVKTHLSNDLMAIGERARLAWAPRWRNGFTLTGTSKLALKSSSRSIKRYCRKKFQSGKKQLHSVKVKLIREAMAAATGNSNHHFTEQQIAFEEKKQESATEEAAADNLFPKPSESNDVDATLDESYNDGEIDEKGGEAKNIVDVMGCLDSCLGTIVIDGDEFFDADENLIESEEESRAATELFVDAFDEARSYEQGSITDAESKNIAETERATAIFTAGNCELPQRSYQGKSTTTEIAKVSERQSSEEDDGPGAVVLEEMPLPRMFVPGRIVHVYSHRGIFKAAYVPRAFRELRRISLAGNMLTDHTAKSYYESLLEVKSVRKAEEDPPRWTAFDEDDTCSCCASRFTWASTSDSEAQEARDKHNCRSCGTLVCDPCSRNRIPLSSIGLAVPVRVCDRCYNDIGGILTGSLSTTNSFVAEGGLASKTSQDFHRPERQRGRRSTVVDDLASRIQESALTCS